MTGTPPALILEVTIGPRREAPMMTEIAWNQFGVGRRICLDDCNLAIGTMHRPIVIRVLQVEMRG